MNSRKWADQELLGLLNQVMSAATMPGVASSPSAPSRQLVNASEPAFRNLVRGALLTGCRYSELTKMQARIFNADAGVVSTFAIRACSWPPMTNRALITPVVIAAN
jgi:hypothetical protein